MMSNVLNWVKNNKVATIVGTVVLGGIALVLTTKNEETEEVTTDVVETEVVTEVVEPNQEN